jgi:hypothetical protein
MGGCDQTSSACSPPDSDAGVEYGPTNMPCIVIGSGERCRAPNGHSVGPSLTSRTTPMTVEDVAGLGWLEDPAHTSYPTLDYTPQVDEEDHI